MKWISCLFLLLWLGAVNAQEVPQVFGAAPERKLATEFDVLVWNIYKAKRPSFYIEFPQYAQGKSLLLIQEALTSGDLLSHLDRYPLEWSFAKSFSLPSGDETGTLIGGQANALTHYMYRSESREVYVFTPKAFNYSYYKVGPREQTLLVINIHGLNFVFNKYFKRQIYAAAEVIKNHQGPVIFAGDFNTHHAWRMNFLNNYLAKLGMQRVIFSQDNRRRALDHIFFRGLKLLESQLYRQSIGSDHLPLSANFSL